MWGARAREGRWACGEGVPSADGGVVNVSEAGGGERVSGSAGGV